MTADSVPTRIFRVTDSSAITQIEYNYQTAKMWVAFTNKTVWRYDSVPAEVFSRMCGSQSVGRAFNQYIKLNYEGVKIYPRASDIRKREYDRQLAKQRQRLQEQARMQALEALRESQATIDRYAAIATAPPTQVAPTTMTVTFE